MLSASRTLLWGLRDVVIVSGCRTPIGAFGGGLKSVPGWSLAATVMKEAVKRAKINPAELGDVRYGCCLSSHDSMNIGRVAALKAGIPEEVPACTINRVCTSAMEALASATFQIQTGFCEAILVGGVESMSNAPYVLPDMRWGARMMDKSCVDAMTSGLHAGSQVVKYPKDGPVEWARGRPYIMGLTAEFLAQKWGITRKEMDEVAVLSHNRTEEATKSGRFKDEIVPISVEGKKKGAPVIIDKDEHFRPGMTYPIMAALPSAFIPKIGTVTAGNASGVNDGACALILMSAERAKALGITPLAKITGIGMGGCEPEYMGESPLPATKDLLRRTGLEIKDFDLIECNEAFAAQYLSCEKGLNLPREKTNVNGSGIGLGHPVGCTGSRIVVTLFHEMMKRKVKRGLATLCGGGGVSIATAIELC